MKKLVVLLVVLMLFFASCGLGADKIQSGLLSDSVFSAEQSSIADVTNDSTPEYSSPADSTPDDSTPDVSVPDDSSPVDSSPDVSVPDDSSPADSSPIDSSPDVSVPDDSSPDDPIDTPVEHNYEAVVTAPTCERAGFTTYTCLNCGDSYVTDYESALEHSYESVVTAPTCDARGFTTYTCSTCGDSYVSNYQSVLGHSYESVVTEPTCNGRGYTTYTCSTCNDSYVSDYVNPTGHSYESVVTKPTCEDKGFTTYTCTNCGSTYDSNETTPTGHSYESVVTAPTCTEGGYTTYTCSVCSSSYVANQVSATGHSWKEATTTAPKTCSTCGATEGDPLPDTTNPGTGSGSESGSGTGSGGSSGGLQTLYVNYIDVGQGDSIFIKVGDCDILIDAGKSGQGTTVCNYLASKGVDDIELMINSHPDNDHYGGLPSVLSKYVVEEIWLSKFAKTTSTYVSFKSAANSEGATVKQPSEGTVFTYESLTLTVLYSTAGSDSNNSSIIAMLEYGSFKFLFVSDAGESEENKVLSACSPSSLKCDVLKVGHHGSAGSSTSSFLSTVGAKYGVISVGAGNSYGHPTAAALGRLSSAGVSVYRTDQDGTVVFSTDGSSLTLPGGGSVSGGSGSGSSGSGSGSDSGSSGSGSTYYEFIGNSNTKKFHLPTCSYLPDPANRDYLYDYYFIINVLGYTPCKVCLKNYTP